MHGMTGFLVYTFGSYFIIFIGKRIIIVSILILKYVSYA